MKSAAYYTDRDPHYQVAQCDGCRYNPAGAHRCVGSQYGTIGGEGPRLWHCACPCRHMKKEAP